MLQTETWVDENGEMFMGLRVNGLLEGEGAWECTDGDDRWWYEGNFENGKRSGYSVYHWPDGSRYEGEWKDNERTGYGIDYYSNGDIYEGEWLNNERAGTGVYKYAEGGRYEGDWLND